MGTTRSTELMYPGVYVDGAWRRASGTGVHTVVNPYTEEPVGDIAVATREDVDAAVMSAEAALHGDWAKFGLDARIELVLRIRDLIDQRREDFALAQVQSSGCLFSYALTLSGAVELFDMYVDSVRQVKFEYVRSDRFGSVLIARRPVGVVGGITPWNAVLREVKKAIPALLSGCTVVLKPAPETPVGGAMFAEICTEAGVPAGVVNLVHGGPTTGEALVVHPRVRKIAFTGSSATGVRIAQMSSPTMKRVQLELGGKSAAILLDDADIDTALGMLASSSWSNAGQVCTMNSRVLAPRSRYDEIVDAFTALARQQVLGDPMDRATTVPPLVSRRQHDNVMRYIETGRFEGARLVTGGGRPAHLDRGFFIEPTIFADVDNSMTIAREEIFGPVTCVIPYDSVDEAVHIANDSDYGLSGSVFSRDDDLALAVARRLDTGQVAVNKAGGVPCAPFGGVKMSGLGREHGPEGFDSLLEYASYVVSSSLDATLRRDYEAG